MSELVAGKRQQLEAAFFVFRVKLLQSLVLPGEAALGWPY